MKKEKKPDYEQGLRESYEHWQDLYENGGFDPFWEDGVNLNLVRNHIIYYKKKIVEEMPLLVDSELMKRPLPPEVDNKYMAQPDRIREDAKAALAAFEADENLKFVREQARHLSEKLRKKLYLPAVIGYADNLKRYIEQDKLVDMRRYRNFGHYLESFADMARKLKDPKILAELDAQPTLADEDEDGYFDEEQEYEEDECAETAQKYSRQAKQDNSSGESEQENEPEEDRQLKLF